MEVLYQLSYRGVFSSWGREDSNLRRRSRQIYSLLPLAARAHPRARLGARAPKRPDIVANAADFSTQRQRSLGRDSNPRPAAYKAAALPLSYPGVSAFQHVALRATSQHAPAFKASLVSYSAVGPLSRVDPDRSSF